MVLWEPEDIDPTDRDGLEDGDGWDADVINDFQKRFEELRQFTIKYKKSRDEATREEMSVFIDATRHVMEELVANQIYDKLTILLNNTRKRLGI